jgi:putative nucleotidyltransferase with HDIG domain
MTDATLPAILFKKKTVIDDKADTINGDLATNTHHRDQTMPTLDEYIDKARHLVPAPTVLPQLIPLLNQPDIDNSRVVDLISYNQSLTANVLRVCNSAFYSRGASIDNLQQAITRIGFRQLYDIVVSSIAAVTLACPQKGYGVEANELWAHSVTTAVAAQLVAKDLRIDEQVTFTAALLHDIGKIVLSLALEDNKAKVAHEAEKNNLSPMEIEMKLLGVNHAEVGGRLLERWKLPENLVAAVRYHHQPTAAKDHSRLAACVYLGNFTAYFMGHGYGRHSLDLKARDETLRILNLPAERLPEYMEKAFEKFKQVKSIYNIK